MSNDGLIPKISDWLKNQGYPLEIQVARTLRRVGFEVSSSEYYLDLEEEKPREIDALASMSTTIDGLKFEIIYVVECKSAKDFPWICFSSDNSARDPSVGFLARTATREGRRALIELSINPDVTTHQLLGLPDHHAYGITNAFRENNRDIPYGALRAAQGAAEALVRYSDRMQAPPTRIDYVCVTFPLVVTSAPLFTVSLDPDGEIKVCPVDHQIILRTGFDTEYSVVEVVTAAALAAYAEARSELIARFLRRLPERIPNTLEELGYANFAADED